MQLRIALRHLIRADWPEAVSQIRCRQAWSLVGILLTPVAVAAGALAAWRFGMDAGWTNAFFISHGILSHWQVWFALAGGAEVFAYSLRRDPAPVDLRS